MRERERTSPGPGGDEFAILLTGRSAEARAEALSTSLIDTLAKPFEIDGRSLEVGVSIGSATSRDRETAGKILARADIALRGEISRPEQSSRLQP